MAERERRLSLQSDAAMQQLLRVTAKFDKFESTLQEALRRIEVGGFKTPLEVGQIADGLAAANGNLEKITIKEVDTVQVGPLTSGKDDVRAMRKGLVRRSEELSQKIRDTYETLKKIKAAGPFPTPLKAPAAGASGQQVEKVEEEPRVPDNMNEQSQQRAAIDKAEIDRQNQRAQRCAQQQQEYAAQRQFTNAAQERLQKLKAFDFKNTIIGIKLKTLDARSKGLSAAC